MGGVDAFIGKGVYLDANVFVYAVEGFPEHQAFIDELFRSIDDGHVSAVTSELTLAEVLIKPLESERHDVAAIYEELLRSSEHLNVVPIDRPFSRAQPAIVPTSGSSSRTLSTSPPPSRSVACCSPTTRSSGSPTGSRCGPWVDLRP